MMHAGRKRDGYTTGVTRVGDDRVSKFVGEEAQIEFQKAQAIERALSGTRFITPKAIDCYPASGLVEFEYVPHRVRLFDAMLEAYRMCEFEKVLAQNRDAAELLAIFHHKLKLPTSIEWTPPSSLIRDLNRAGRHWPYDNAVFLHCDFSSVNILINNTGGLAVIDASPNQYLTKSANLIGPPVIDVATYTVRLHWPFRARTYRKSWRRFADMLRADFLNGYERSAGVVLDRTILKIFELNIVRSFVDWKLGSSVASRLSTQIARLALPS
jgi:hypothetical protein